MDDVLDCVCSLHRLGDHHRPDAGMVSPPLEETSCRSSLNLFVPTTVSIQISSLTNYPEPDLEPCFHLLICEPIALLTWQSRLVTALQFPPAGPQWGSRGFPPQQADLLSSWSPLCFPPFNSAGHVATWLEEFYINLYFLHNSMQNLSEDVIYFAYMGLFFLFSQASFIEIYSFLLNRHWWLCWTEKPFLSFQVEFIRVQSPTFTHMLLVHCCVQLRTQCFSKKGRPLHHIHSTRICKLLPPYSIVT